MLQKLNPAKIKYNYQYFEIKEQNLHLQKKTNQFYSIGLIVGATCTLIINASQLKEFKENLSLAPVADWAIKTMDIGLLSLEIEHLTNETRVPACTNLGPVLYFHHVFAFYYFSPTQQSLKKLMYDFLLFKRAKNLLLHA